MIFLAFIIKINFPDDSEFEASYEDDNFANSNQHVYGDELSSFRNDVTPEPTEAKSTESVTISDNSKVTILKLLCNARYTMAALASSLVYFCYSFMEPILAERLTDFDLTSMQIGIFFAIYAIFYIPSSVVVQFLPKRVDKRFTIILSSLLTGVSFLFVGPSQIFQFPDSLVLMGIGQALAGIFTAFMMIPGLPEMVESTLPLYPGQEREVNDLSSGLFNAFLGIGQVFAPFYGAFMVEAVGFRMTSDIVGVICMFFALTYFIVAGGTNAFKKTCRKKTE